MKKPLITIAIDFIKAIDSINRKSLIEYIKKFRMHPAPHHRHYKSYIYTRRTELLYTP